MERSLGEVRKGNSSTTIASTGTIVVAAVFLDCELVRCSNFSRELKIDSRNLNPYPFKAHHKDTTNTLIHTSVPM